MTLEPLPNLAETRLAEAISRIGQSRFEAALWDLCQALVRPDNLVILAYRDNAQPHALYRRTFEPAVFAELDRTYLAGAYRLDPFFALHLDRVPDGAYRLRDIAPDAFHRSRYFLEYYHQTTLIDEIGFVVWPVPGVSVQLALGRDAASGRAFMAHEIETCHRLSPVIAALTRAHWQGIGSSAGPAEDTPVMLADAARRQGIQLSPRQAEVALMILRGYSTVSIALRLGLSPQTVKVFRKQLYRRCGISTQAQLFALMLPLLKEGAQSSAGAPVISAFGRGSVGMAPVAR
jgi:DNA-binding CsgD family transcriptional regulator